MSANNPVRIIYIGHSENQTGSVVAFGRLNDTHAYHVMTYARANCLMKKLLGEGDLNVSASRFEVIKMIFTPAGMSVWMRHRPVDMKRIGDPRYRVLIFDRSNAPIDVEEYDDWKHARERVLALRSDGEHRAQIFTRNDNTGKYESLVQPAA